MIFIDEFLREERFDEQLASQFIDDVLENGFGEALELRIVFVRRCAFNFIELPVDVLGLHENVLVFVFLLLLPEQFLTYHDVAAHISYLLG